jgi:hypothetical protein
VIFQYPNIWIGSRSETGCAPAETGSKIVSDGLQVRHRHAKIRADPLRTPVIETGGAGKSPDRSAPCSIR